MSVENKKVNWAEALKLATDKTPWENTTIEPKNLKYYLTHSEYNILLLAVQSLIEDYSEQLEAGFPGSTGSSGTYWDSYRVIKKGSTASASDSTLYTSLMTLEKLKELKADIQDIIDNLDEKYLSKINPDTANELITFLKGLEVTDVEGKDKINITPERLSFQHEGELGWGDTQYYIDSEGYAHLKGLILEEYLEVPELSYNRIEINIGDSWRAPGGGVILSVVESSTTTGTVTLKLDDGESGAIAENDLCMGIFHFMGDGKSNNATEDTDDFEIGERTIKGFATSYFQIMTVSEDRTSFTYRLRWATDSSYSGRVHPQPTMNFVGFGNTTNKNRQTSSYQTRTYQRYMVNRDDWSYTMANISAQFGDLTTLGGDYDEYSAYLSNVYFTGKIEQIIADKIEVRLAKEKISVEKDALGQYILGPQITSNVLSVMEGDRLLTPTNNTIEGDLKAGEYFINIEGTDIIPGEVSINTVDRNITIGDSSNMTADIARILYNIKFKRANGKNESIAKYQEISFLKGIPGEPGEPGTPGVGIPIVYRGTWDDTKTYYGNDKRMDIVKYDDHYWKAKNVTGSSTTGFEGIATKPGVSSSHWDSFGAEFESVATELLLAEKANIANFSFVEGVMMSHAGVIMLPDGTIQREANLVEDLQNEYFTSNLVLNGNTGQINALKGSIGGFNIVNDTIQSVLTEGDDSPAISMNSLTGEFKASKVDLKGIIKATGGNIGGFKIEEGKLTTTGAGLSGVEGVDKKDPAFWAGGTYDQAIDGTAKAIIRHDGSGHLAGGGITWDEVGNSLFTGALASPFERTKSTYTKDFSNNLIVTGSIFILPWDQLGSGRLIRLIQPKPVGPLGASCTAPSGKYFYEDGEQKDTLTMVGQEIIELLGYTDSLGEFKGWLILNRGLLHTASTRGEPQRIVAHGRVKTNDPFKYHTFDGSTLTTSTGEINSRKYTSIIMPNKWFDSADGYYVKIIGNGRDSSAFHTVEKVTNFTFGVYQHSLNRADGTLSPTTTFDFYFEIYSAAWLYPKTGEANLPGMPW